MKRRVAFLMLIGLSTLGVMTRCSKSSQPVAPKSEEHAHPGDHGHSHGAGPHDGTLADWGGGKYHVEFTVDHATSHGLHPG